MSDLIERLKARPHLRLPVTVDADALREELFAEPAEYVPFKVKSGLAHLDDDFQNLNVVGIMDVTADPRAAGTYLPALRAEGHVLPSVFTNCRETEFGSHTPKTIATLREIGETPARCKLSRLGAGKVVPAHQHPHVAYNEQVIHIPLVTNPGVEMIVIDDSDVRHVQHYGVGEVWLFNNWHRHAVANTGPTDRYHLWLNYFLFDGAGNRINQRLWSLIETALNEVES